MSNEVRDFAETCIKALEQHGRDYGGTNESFEQHMLNARALVQAKLKEYEKAPRCTCYRNLD